MLWRGRGVQKGKKERGMGSREGIKSFIERADLWELAGERYNLPGLFEITEEERHFRAG